MDCDTAMACERLAALFGAEFRLLGNIEKAKWMEAKAKEFRLLAIKASCEEEREYRMKDKQRLRGNQEG